MGWKRGPRKRLTEGSQPIFGKGTKAIQWKKYVFQLKQLGNQMQQTNKQNMNTGTDFTHFAKINSKYLRL